MTMKALCNVRPSRLPDPLPPRSPLIPGLAAVSRLEEAGGAVMSCRKVPAVRYRNINEMSAPSVGKGRKADWTKS
jgi:hypothetical protein